MKANHGLPPRPSRIDPKDIDGDITRDRDNVAPIADELPAIAVKRHSAIAPGQNGAKTFAPEQRGRLKRNSLELRATSAARERDRKPGDHGDDQHDRHHFDEREAGFTIDIAWPSQRSPIPVLLMSQLP
jgi:hypothetical protein